MVLASLGFLKLTKIALCLTFKNVQEVALEKTANRTVLQIANFLNVTQ